MFVVCAALAIGAMCCAAHGDAVDDIVAKLDPNADVIIAAPNLKRASDELTRCIEGMDRANLLLGSRPIDQIKSMCAVSAGLDELRGAAVMFYITDELPSVESAVFVVPVTDMGAFVEGNFESIGAGGDAEAQPSTVGGEVLNRYKHASGRAIFVKEIAGEGAKFVALSWSDATLERYKPGGFDATAQEILGDDREALRRGELFIAINGETAEKIARVANQFDRVPAVAQNYTKTIIDRVAGQTANGIHVVDFDALAAVVRSHVQLRETIEQIEPAIAAQNSKNTFSKAPRRPYYLAAHLEPNMIAFARRCCGAGVEDESLTALLDRLLSVEVVSYREGVEKSGDDKEDETRPSAFKGGLLKNTIVLGSGGEPETLRNEFVEWVRRLDEAKDWESKIGAAREIASRNVNVLSAKPRFQGEVALVAGTLHDLLIGPYGWQGMAMTVDGDVLITCSQANNWARTMIEEIEGKNNKFAGDSVVQTMRSWLPARRDLEMYIDVAALREAGDDFIEYLPAGEGAPAMTQTRRDYGKAVPPIGVGAAIDGDRLECTIVLPGKALAVLVDDFVAWQRAQMVTMAQPRAVSSQ